MRHLKKINKLSRTSEQRSALLKSLAVALIEKKKLVTTVAKAKELRKYVEPMVTRAKEDTTHNRRIVFSDLNHKESMKELFGEIGPKAKNRPGGYTRIIKIGNRSGDAAEMALIELVDYNDVKPETSASKVKKTRRSRSKKADAPAATAE